MKEFNSVYEELTALNESPISNGEYTLRLAFDIGITTAKELEEFKAAYKKEHPGCIDDLTTMLINYKKELGPNFQINSIMDEPINEGFIKDLFKKNPKKTLEEIQKEIMELLKDPEYNKVMNDAVKGFANSVQAATIATGKKLGEDLAEWERTWQIPGKPDIMGPGNVQVNALAKRIMATFGADTGRGPLTLIETKSSKEAINGEVKNRIYFSAPSSYQSDLKPWKRFTGIEGWIKTEFGLSMPDDKMHFFYIDEPQNDRVVIIFEYWLPAKTNEALEEEPEIPESFEDKMNFLAADEQEAIDGYDLIIAALSDEDANVKEQLEKIKTEEIAHKEFLEKVKEDRDLVYTEPLEQEEE